MHVLCILHNEPSEANEQRSLISPWDILEVHLSSKSNARIDKLLDDYNRINKEFVFFIFINIEYEDFFNFELSSNLK